MLVVHLSGSSQKKNHCQEGLLKSYQVHGKRWEQGKRYNSHIERFGKFCRQSYTDPIQASTEMGIESLNEYFKTGVGYSPVNFARSTLPSIIKPVSNVPFGKPSLVCRLLKMVRMLQVGMLLKFLLYQVKTNSYRLCYIYVYGVIYTGNIRREVTN